MSVNPYTSHRQELLAQSARPSPELPPPPYFLSHVSMLYLVCRFDLAVARQVLPTPLDPTDEGLGVMMIVDAPKGWAIAPFTGCVNTLQIKGYDGADQYPANLVHTAFYSGACVQAFRRYSNDHAVEGSGLIQVVDDQIRASGGRDGQDAVRVSARLLDGTTDEVVGMNHYITRFEHTLHLSSTSYTTRFRDLADVNIEVLDTASEPLRSLKPLEVVGLSGSKACRWSSILDAPWALRAPWWQLKQHWERSSTYLALQASRCDRRGLRTHLVRDPGSYRLTRPRSFPVGGVPTLGRTIELVNRTIGQRPRHHRTPSGSATGGADNADNARAQR